MIKKNRYDYFLIWGHGQSFKQEIIEIIDDEEFLDIKRIEDYKPKSIKKLVQAIYSYDYAPFHHLKAKTRYLNNTPKHVTFIFVKNEFVKEVFEGQGSFRHIESPKIVEVKRKVRQIFNPKINGQISENHVIHASDNESQVNYMLNYLGYKQGCKLFDAKNSIIGTPYHIKRYNKFYIKKISIDKLKCNILLEKSGQTLTELIPIKSTPHYEVINGSDQPYKDYILKFQGKELKDYYSIKKFKKLIENYEYENTDDFIVAKKIYNDYQILDGVHRASILACRGFSKINITVVED